MKMNNIFAEIGSAIRVVAKTSVSFLRFLWNLFRDFIRRACFLFHAWRKSRKELTTLQEKEQTALWKAEKIETDTQWKISAFAKEVASSRENAQAVQNRLKRASQDLQDCQKGFQQSVQETASEKANLEISELRRQREQSEEELAIVRRRCRALMESLKQRIDETESENLLPLERDAKKLLNLLETWVKTPRMQQSKTIANVLDEWWKDNYAGFLETAEELNSRLSQLPDELDDYTIQFKGYQKRLWLQPNDWTIDDGNLVLKYSSNAGEPFTVEGLRSLLGGDTTNNFGDAVNGDMEVLLKLKKNIKRYRPLDISFSISHDKELVVIMMDDDGTFDGYDEDYGNTNNDSEEAETAYTEYGDDNENEDAENDDNNDYSGSNYNADEDDGGDGKKNEAEVEIDPGCEGGEHDDDGPEHDYDTSRSGSDLDQAFLDTANDLFERLDELPKKCDDFLVRFTAANSDNWIQPEEWHIDDDGDLIFGLYDDGENHDDEELTVADLKDILTGGRDDGDAGVEEDTSIYVDDSDSDTYFRLLDEHFKIHWKDGLVYIPMIEDCGNNDDYEDEDDEGSDEDDDGEFDEDEDEDNESDEDEDDNEYDETNCEEDDEDERGDEEDDADNQGEDGVDDEDDENGDDFARRAASSLVLGLTLENGLRRNSRRNR